MKDREKFLRVHLYEFEDEKNGRYVNADFFNDALTFSGYETGDDVEGFWGEDDYEYWYKLDPENTQKLMEIIGGVEDPAGAILREFGGIKACSHLCEICDANGIEYHFESYV